MNYQLVKTTKDTSAGHHLGNIEAFFLIYKNKQAIVGLEISPSNNTKIN